MSSRNAVRHALQHAAGWLAVCALAGFAGGAAAQFTESVAATYRLPDFRFHVLPTPGVYFDPAQSGTGLTVDTVPVTGGTFVFSTYYHYGSDGAPEWMNFGTTLRPGSLSEYTADGLPASLRGQWVRADQGQCFDCAYTPYTVSYPPYGERTIEIVDGRTLRLPPSGAATARTMQLGKTQAPSAAEQARTLLESGEVWQVYQRWYTAGVEYGNYGGPPTAYANRAGLVRFARRAAAKNWRYLAPVSTSWIEDGQGGYLPAQPAPMWMHVPTHTDLNAIPTQYQIEMLKTGGALGYRIGGRESLTFDDPSQPNGNYTGTVFIHPVSGEIFAVQHCIACTNGGGGSFFRDNAAMNAVGRLVHAGVDGEGSPRLLLRMWSMKVNGWELELEFVRLTAGHRLLELPNYVPNANPR